MVRKADFQSVNRGSIPLSVIKYMARKSKKRNNGRDYLMVAIINGVTKAAVFPDKKKETNKKKCRKKVIDET